LFPNTISRGFDSFGFMHLVGTSTFTVHRHAHPFRGNLFTFTHLVLHRRGFIV